MWNFRAPKADRIDRLLRAAKLEGSEWLSRSAFDVLIEKGRVSVNGRRVKKAGDQVMEGAEITVQIPPLGLLSAAEPAELLWADEGKTLALFVKVAGIASYPLLPWENETFANRVVSLLKSKSWMEADAFSALAEKPKLEGGLLQRLDRDTSGVLAVALNAEVKAKLREAFSSGKFRKTYLAIVSGRPKEGSFSFLISDAQGGKVKAIASQESGASKIELRVESSAGGFSYVRVVTQFGARHIVRASMAALGSPLVGDASYGGDVSVAGFHQLHAERLELLENSIFPGFPSELRAPAPESFLDCKTKLGLHSIG